MECKGRSAERYERNEALERNGTEKGTCATSKWPLNMLCTAPLKGGGDLSEIWGKHVAGGKGAIPLLRQGLRWNAMEAKRLLRVLRFMPIDA
jgi:hypothetical protein